MDLGCLDRGMCVVPRLGGGGCLDGGMCVVVTASMPDPLPSRRSNVRMLAISRTRQSPSQTAFSPINAHVSADDLQLQRNYKEMGEP